MSCRLDECWKPQLIQDLEDMNIEVSTPALPLKREITLDNWMTGLDAYKDKIDKDTVFVCHSLSSVFIVKYLYKYQLKPKALISVSGGYMPIARPGYEFLKDFLMYKEEMQYVSHSVAYRYHIHSDNDTIWEPTEIEGYTNHLHMTEIVLSGVGHIGRHSGVKSLPQITDIIRSINK